MISSFPAASRVPELSFCFDRAQHLPWSLRLSSFLSVSNCKHLLNQVVSKCTRSLQMLIGWFVLEEELPSVPFGQIRFGGTQHHVKSFKSIPDWAKSPMKSFTTNVLCLACSIFQSSDGSSKWSSDLGLLDLMSISETSLQLLCGILNWGSAKLVNSKLLPKGGSVSKIRLLCPPPNSKVSVLCDRLSKQRPFHGTDILGNVKKLRQWIVSEKQRCQLSPPWTDEQETGHHWVTRRFQRRKRHEKEEKIDPQLAEQRLSYDGLSEDHMPSYVSCWKWNLLGLMANQTSP